MRPADIISMYLFFFTSISCTSRKSRPIRLLSDKKKNGTSCTILSQKATAVLVGIFIFLLRVKKKPFNCYFYSLYPPLWPTIPSAHSPPFSSHLLSCACSGGPVAGVGSVVGLQRDVQHRLPAATAALQLLGARLGRVQGSPPGESRVQQPFLQR